MFLEFPARYDTNRAVQTQKKAGDLGSRGSVMTLPMYRISCAVTAKLICDFVFAYSKNRFSHDAAH